ncbi:GFA family protein [Brevundimonas sp.]|uniref:GFA family protein n=2 Tax=unclassified Brevundimonas TaxID=2622653 RepID=UPI00289A123E|nr:GFA family protein [Brevundimonas sp.]
MISGRCHCGAVHYQMSENTIHHTLCHCTDCRRASGAPAVAWALVKREDIRIEGQPKSYASSPGTERLFCSDCGTSLFFVNEQIFPGMIDVQSATLDNPAAIPLQAQIQTDDRIGWMENLHSLPSFGRYPPME